MKANAPEKLYLSKNIYSTYLYQVPDPDDETAVEYIRTDAFVKKACDWLFDQAHNYTDVDIDYKGAVYSKTHTDKMIEDFRKAMGL